MANKEHRVQVFTNGYRYSATELKGTLSIRRDGTLIGEVAWRNEQLILSTALLPDDAVEALERKLKEAFEAFWWEE